MTNTTMPIYLLMDCSIQNTLKLDELNMINQSICNMISNFKDDPQCLETVQISLITFDSFAKVEVELTELTDFTFDFPTLKVGETHLGTALNLLESVVVRDSFSPLVIVVMRNRPVDEWLETAQRLKKNGVHMVLSGFRDSALTDCGCFDLEIKKMYLFDRL
jgi:uncharacterized protein YegL